MTVRMAPVAPKRGTERSADIFLDDVLALSRMAFANAAHLDHDGAFPLKEIAQLAVEGGLSAPLPMEHGGLGLTKGPLMLAALRLIGNGSLPLCRLYEGHVNAIGFIQRYGTPGQLARAARDVAQGLLFGVWNTELASGLRLERSASGGTLVGSKSFASGAGFVARPLVTVVAAGEQIMVLPRLAPDDQSRADLSNWKPHGMRASATGDFDYTGLAVEDDDIIGMAGDYHRQPGFSGGAWRFAAVQLGGIERLIDELRDHLARTGREGDPHQRARLGAAAIAAETAHLWVVRACEMAEGDGDAEQVIAYVNLARTAVERAGLEVIELAQRSIGLAGLHRGHPIEHVFRDLATYLRQPAPDKALTDAAIHVLARTAATGEL